MCPVVDFRTFRHLAQVEGGSQDTVAVVAVYLNRDAAGAHCGLVLSSTQGYVTVLWIGNHIVRRGHQCHVWYEATFDDDGDLVAISTFVRSEALDSRTSSLRTLVSSVRALTAMAHLRFEACGKRAGSYMVSGCQRSISELTDLLER